MYTAYYSLVYTEEVPDTEDTTKKIVYSGYKPKYGHPMCLYSSDGFPIALLELRYQNKNLYNEGHDSFITELPSNTDQTKQSFQAITTKDNEAIEFVITNTTESYINFNLILDWLSHTLFINTSNNIGTICNTSYFSIKFDD